MDEEVFKYEKFRELVLYIARKAEDDPDFGRTKLAKVLFYSDFAAYAEEGTSLTGATYKALEFGPFPPELPTVEEQLASEKRATVERFEPGIEHVEYEPWRIVPLDDPDLSLFEPWELVFVDQWIEKIAGASAKAISILSHDHPGWILAEKNRDAIPYETAFIGTKRPPDRAVARGRQLAGEFGWS
jgi:hypothetical protein